MNKYSPWWISNWYNVHMGIPCPPGDVLQRFAKRLNVIPARFAFGATSAVITILALIFGLAATTNPKPSIVAGILVIAIADNISDTLGIHIYGEAETHTSKEVFASTFSNFFARLLVSLLFLPMMWFMPLQAAVAASLTYGLLVICVISYIIAVRRGISILGTILEHVTVALVIVVTSNYIGKYLTLKLSQ